MDFLKSPQYSFGNQKFNFKIKIKINMISFNMISLKGNLSNLACRIDENLIEIF